MKYPIEITINNINEPPVIKVNNKVLENIIQCKIDFTTNTQEISDKKILIEYFDKDTENIKIDTFISLK